jgi:hypothetical protein
MYRLRLDLSEGNFAAVTWIGNSERKNIPRDGEWRERLSISIGFGNAAKKVTWFQADPGERKRIENPD